MDWLDLRRKIMVEGETLTRRQSLILLDTLIETEIEREKLAHVAIAASHLITAGPVDFGSSSWESLEEALITLADYKLGDTDGS